MAQHGPPDSLPPHPVAFLLLIIPFGVASGFVTVTVAFMLARAGVDTEAVAALVAASLAPQAWKFLWAPLVDSTLRPKRWYAIGVGLTSLAVCVTGWVPTTAAGLPMQSLLAVLASVSSTFVSMSIESMLPHNTVDATRGRASGWMQAGSLGGSSIGGGAALWLMQNLPDPWMASTITAATCLLCALPLVWLGEPELPEKIAGGRGTVLRIAEVLRSLWRMARSPKGALGLLIMVLPAGSGAAGNLWSTVSSGWQATADQVALVNGALGGIVSMVGCLLGGPVCDRLERRTAYVLFGLLLSLCTAAMALAPHTPMVFMGFTLLYALINGMCYTGYSAVALDSSESGAAATQFNAFSSLANMPLVYMALLEGWAYAHHGAAAMLWSETLASLAGILLFGLVSWRLNGGRPLQARTTSPL